MELSNALKSLLATLTTKTTAEYTDGVMLANIQNGTPSGKITLDKLFAYNDSKFTRFQAGDNLNNLKTGKYASYTSGTISSLVNIPTFPSGTVRITLFCVSDSSIADSVVQILIDETYGSLYERSSNNGTWTAWRLLSVQEFLKPYTTLAGLTSAVYKGQWYGNCTTAADTAAKTCTISGFLAVPTSVVTVHFASAINVAASTLNGTTATLNISSTGAKPIMYKGVPVQPGVVRAGNLVTMQYDGTNYNIIGIEGLEASAVPSNLYVDMGLPSGTLWATRNIDITQANGFAASEYQYECSFFSWGNTEGHNPTSSSAFAYNWGDSNDDVYASTQGSKIMGQLSPSQDFARANCGAPWRLPTSADCAELIANIEYIDANGSVIPSSTTDKRITMNGVVGLRVRSTTSSGNGKILFLPCSGVGQGASWSSRSENGRYWTSSIYSASADFGNSFGFNVNGVHPTTYDSRYQGFAARPVM